MPRQSLLRFFKTQDFTDEVQRRAFFVNILSWSLILPPLFYAIPFIASGQLWLAFMNAMFAGLFLVPIYLNKKAMHFFGSLWLITSLCLAILVYDSLLGANSGIHLVTFSIICLALVIFLPKTISELLASISIPITTLGLIVLFNHQILPIQTPINTVLSSALYFLSLFTTVGLIVFAIRFHLILSFKYEKSLLDSSTELQAKAALDKELKTAQEIQANILPQYDPPYKGYHLQHVFLPAKQVSGDYYDYFPFSSTRVGIVVADIVGKGIPASLMMIAFKNLLHSTLRKSDSPSKTLAKLNTLIYQNKILEKYIPIFYGILDTEQHTFTYANGGHEHGLLLHNLEERELAKGGVPVGMYETASFDEETIHLEPSDRLIMYTDGFTDIKNKNAQKLGIEAFKILIKIHNSNTETEDFVGEVTEKILSYFEGQTQTDDITLVTIKRL